MSFSIQRETSDGTLSTLDLTIEYIDRTDVRAYVNDIEIDLTGGVTPYTWEWITDSQIEITPVVPNGLVAMVKRSTPMDAMYHVYDAGAVFKDETVDENFKQVLFLTQEAKEGSGVSDIYSNVNMHGYVIGNHGAALLDGDLVTFGQYRNDSLGSGFNRVAAEAARDVAVAAKDTVVASTAAAALSETNAAASALSAGNSASSANANRVLAENAAVAAAGSLDEFTDIYLGPKAVDPTLDNDGVALLEGALYWNNTVKEMRTYNGVAWVAAYLPVGAYVTEDELANATDPAKGAGMVGYSGRTVFDALSDVINVIDDGARLDGSDASSVVNAAIIKAASDGRAVYIPGRGSQITLNATIEMLPGVKLVCDANIQAGNQQDIIKLAGCVGSVIEINGTITGDGVNAAQSGVVVSDSSRCHVILRGSITGVLNKGVSLVGTVAGGTICTGNDIYVSRVSGAVSATGAGVSLFGDACAKNRVTVVSATGNRIGVSLNAAHDNDVYVTECDGNTTAGLMIDGVVTASGDGGKRNRIYGGSYSGTAPSTAYGGIYLGNGSSDNVFFNPVCNNNSGAGIRHSGGAGYECSRNKYYAPECAGNGTSGVTLSHSPDTTLIAPEIFGNTVRGVAHSLSPRFKMTGGRLAGNGGAGYLAQSPGSSVIQTEVFGNSIGLQVAAGGSPAYSNHSFIGVDVHDNTQDYSFATATARVVAASGAGNPPVSVGDANVTGLPGVTFIYNTPITATRTVAAPVAAFPGERVRVVRTPNATGAFSVFFAGLKGLAAGQWLEAERDGATWVLVGFGAL